MKITVAREPKYAPCGYLVCPVIDGQWDTRDDATTVLVQSDWDFPDLAKHFGFVPTDGDNAITEAIDWLDDHLGMVIDDPGYFCGG